MNICNCMKGSGIMISISKRYINFLLSCGLTTILMIIGFFTHNLNVMFISVLLIYVFNVYVVFHSENTALYLGFLFTFFIYLLGRYLTLMLQGKNWYEGFSFSSASCICICLYISLLAVSIGFELSSKGGKKYLDIEDTNAINEYINENYGVRYVSKYLFYFTLVFAIVENLESAIFVQANTYLSLYTSFASTLPSFVHKLAGANDLSLCIFLSTLPSVKETRRVSFFYLLCNLISIFSGVRGTFINSLLFLVLYYWFRQNLDRKNGVNSTWITKSMRRTAIIGLPVLIVLLSLYNVARDGNTVQWNGFFNEILQFFKDQGGSANVIGYTEYFKSSNSLPSTNQSYLFGPVISLFKYGFFGSFFSGQTEILNNTKEMALYGNNLGATITYLVDSSRWLSGGGLGTEYIAEAYADFGYLGVTVFNLFLGVLISKANFLKHKKWYVNAIYANIMICILRMPRNNALSFVPLLISVFNWGIIILVYIISKTIDRKHTKNN